MGRQEAAPRLRIWGRGGSQFSAFDGLNDRPWNRCTAGLILQNGGVGGKWLSSISNTFRNDAWSTNVWLINPPKRRKTSKEKGWKGFKRGRCIPPLEKDSSLSPPSRGGISGLCSHPFSAFTPVHYLNKQGGRGRDGTDWPAPLLLLLLLSSDEQLSLPRSDRAEGGGARLLMNFKLAPIHNATTPSTSGMNRRWQSKTADLIFLETLARSTRLRGEEIDRVEMFESKGKGNGWIFGEFRKGWRFFWIIFDNFRFFVEISRNFGLNSLKFLDRRGWGGWIIFQTEA